MPSQLRKDVRQDFLRYSFLKCLTALRRSCWIDLVHAAVRLEHHDPTRRAREGNVRHAASHSQHATVINGDSPSVRRAEYAWVGAGLAQALWRARPPEGGQGSLTTRLPHDPVHHHVIVKALDREIERLHQVR